MSNFSNQLEEIRTLISSNTKTDKSLAYSTLMHLQEQVKDCPSSIQSLAESSKSLIPLVVADIDVEDEEIAAQSLKCLGFMIYHPSLVATHSVDEASLVLESLAKLITTSKIKAVCNLGVWCISIQQLNNQVLASHFHSLLQALTFALENPFGSLSTTFEAIQAVTRLAGQLREQMQDVSHVWAPPIYRRLLSMNKRERDMSERGLLKIRSLIIPPSLNLSKECDLATLYETITYCDIITKFFSPKKVLVKDIKQKLLSGMNNLLSQGMKIQTILAWGWFIRLVGSHALKNRHLVNDMLKIPEHTFSDHDSQVQIASQAAWKGLIDALIHSQRLSCKSNASKGDDGIQPREASKSNEIEGNGLLKSVKLIMTPLISIMSSSCGASVHSSCFNTWCYLLHKLDYSLNSSLIMNLVLMPIFEVVFQIGPHSKRIWLWNMCIDLLDDYILAKCRDGDHETHNLPSHHLSTSSSLDGPSISGKCSLQYSIKWLAWNLTDLDFNLRIIHILIVHASKATVSYENRSLAYDSSLRLFRSLSIGIQVELKKPSTEYSNVMLCLNVILKFIKNLCEESCEASDKNELCLLSLRFTEVFIEEIEPVILCSPLYMVALDLKYIQSLKVTYDDGYANDLGMCAVSYMDMVSPMVYLTAQYFCLVVQSTSFTVHRDFEKAIYKYVKIMFSSYDPMENLMVAVGLLYRNTEPGCLRMWLAIAEGLKDYIGGMNEFSLCNVDQSSIYFAICRLLSYPFFVCYYYHKEILSTEVNCSLDKYLVSLQRKVSPFHQVLGIWKSVYVSLCMSRFKCFITKSFFEDLCNMLDGWLQKYTGILEDATDLELPHKRLYVDHIFSLYGGVVACILEQSQPTESHKEENHKHRGDYNIFGDMKSCLTLAIRFMKLQNNVEKDLPVNHVVVSRVYSAMAHFISCLNLKLDILSFLEIAWCPLLKWMVKEKMRDDDEYNQFALIWKEILLSLQRSQPPVTFDSAFLKFLSPILEKNLDHPNPSISEPTISFWNSTYGKRIKLEYPKKLLPVLDKLSRNGRINIQTRSSPPIKKCDSRLLVNTAREKYRVNATNTLGSKRVELVKDGANERECNEILDSCLKRKRLDLTEHQREVKRAQQGRERDSGGHGPGIKTYTSVDFSQGNEDSQESQDIQNEFILEMLTRGN